MRVLVCGDRSWSNRGKVMHRFLELPNDTVVIHGDAEGADRIADAVAMVRGMPREAFPAEWEKYGRAAGPRRNQRMLDEGRPDLVIAFHSDLKHSRGTADMVRRAQAAGVPVEVVR